MEVQLSSGIVWTIAMFAAAMVGLISTGIFVRMAVMAYDKHKTEAAPVPCIIVAVGCGLLTIIAGFGMINGLMEMFGTLQW